MLGWLTISWEPTQRRLLSGPAKLALLRPDSSGNRSLQLSTPPETESLWNVLTGDMLPATNLLIAQLTNPGPKALELWGWDSSSPVYSVYVQGTNGWQRYESRKSPQTVSILPLGSTQTLSFAVLCPATDQPWFIGLAYREPVPPSTPFKPRTRFGSVVDSIRAALPFSGRSILHSYYVTNTPAFLQGGPKQPLQHSSSLRLVPVPGTAPG